MGLKMIEMANNGKPDPADKTDKNVLNSSQSPWSPLFRLRDWAI